MKRSKIFVSYRRNDSRSHAHRIAEWLNNVYGSENVFIDFSDIHGGQNWQDVLDSALDGANILLAVIGAQWVPEILRRTESEDIDFVRKEIAYGLKNIPLVIPVWMTREIDIDVKELPEDVQLITEKQRMPVRDDEDFESDMMALVKRIDEYMLSETQVDEYDDSPKIEDLEEIGEKQEAVVESPQTKADTGIEYSIQSILIIKVILFGFSLCLIAVLLVFVIGIEFAQILMPTFFAIITGSGSLIALMIGKTGLGKFLREVFSHRFSSPILITFFILTIAISLLLFWERETHQQNDSNLTETEITNHNNSTVSTSVNQVVTDIPANGNPSEGQPQPLGNGELIGIASIIITNDAAESFVIYADADISFEGLVIRTSIDDRTIIDDFNVFELGDTSFSQARCFAYFEDSDDLELPSQCDSLLLSERDLRASEIFWYDSRQRDLIPFELIVDGSRIGDICEPNVECVFEIPIHAPSLQETRLEFANNFSGETNDAWLQEYREPVAFSDEHYMVLVPRNGNQPPFWMDQFEVTNSQYMRCDNPSCAIIQNNTLDLPVTSINPEQAEAYCNWRENFETESPNYRLPLVAEWQFAAGGVENLSYPWGDWIENGENHVVYNGTSLQENGDRTLQAANSDEFSFGQSWVGALHMSGNVAEWGLSGNDYVTLGGSFLDVRERVSVVSERNQDFADLDVGFRCIREIGG